MSFLERIYYWLYTGYSEGLELHLQGIAYCEEVGDYTHLYASYYNVVGIISLISVGVIGGFFYYLWNPAARMRMKWFLLFGVTAIINFFVGFGIPYSDMINNTYSLPDGMSYNGYDCFLFGISNLIVTVCFFIITSYIIRWGSINNKYIPF